MPKISELSRLTAAEVTDNEFLLINAPNEYGGISTKRISVDDLAQSLMQERLDNVYASIGAISSGGGSGSAAHSNSIYYHAASNSLKNADNDNIIIDLDNICIEDSGERDYLYIGSSDTITSRASNLNIVPDSIVTLNIDASQLQSAVDTTDITSNIASLLAPHILSPNYMYGVFYDNSSKLFAYPDLDVYNDTPVLDLRTLVTANYSDATGWDLNVGSSTVSLGFNFHGSSTSFLEVDDQGGIGWYDHSTSSYTSLPVVYVDCYSCLHAGSPNGPTLLDNYVCWDDENKTFINYNADPFFEQSLVLYDSTTQNLITANGSEISLGSDEETINYHIDYDNLGYDEEDVTVQPLMIVRPDYGEPYLITPDGNSVQLRYNDLPDQIVTISDNYTLTGNGGGAVWLDTEDLMIATISYNENLGNLPEITSLRLNQTPVFSYQNGSMELKQYAESALTLDLTRIPYWDNDHSYFTDRYGNALNLPNSNNGLNLYVTTNRYGHTYIAYVDENQTEQELMSVSDISHLLLFSAGEQRNIKFVGSQYNTENNNGIDPSLLSSIKNDLGDATGQGIMYNPSRNTIRFDFYDSNEINDWVNIYVPTDNILYYDNANNRLTCPNSPDINMTDKIAEIIMQSSYFINHISNYVS